MRELTRPINATPPYARAVRRASWKSRVDAKTRTLQNSKLERYYHNTRVAFRLGIAYTRFTGLHWSYETRAWRVAPLTLELRDCDCHTARDARACFSSAKKQPRVCAAFPRAFASIETARKSTTTLSRNESTGAKSLSAYPETLRSSGTSAQVRAKNRARVQPTAAAARRERERDAVAPTPKPRGRTPPPPPSAAPGRSRLSRLICASP